MHRMLALGLVVAACGGGKPPPPMDPVSPPPADPDIPPPDVGGGGGGGGPVAAECPKEGGSDAPDGVDGAVALEAGETRGCFAVGDKRDTFAVSTPAGPPVLYKISYEGAAKARGCIEMIDAAKAEAKWTDRCAAAEGGTHQAWAIAAGGSQWFLQVHDLAGTAGADARPYKLSVEALPTTDADEPNNKAEEAKPLALGQPRQAFFFSALNAPPEQDWYTFDLAKAGTLAIKVTSPDPGIQFAVVVTDGKNKKVFEKGVGSGGGDLEVSTKLKKGAHKLQIRNIAGQGTPPVGKGEPPSYATKAYEVTATLKK